MGKLFQLSESLIGMLSVIGSQIRRLYSARLIRDSGGGEKDINGAAAAQKRLSG
jgi:hypothetical protein